MADATVAGPGFINIRLSVPYWQRLLVAVAAAGEDYGRSQVGAGKRVNVEYVSANPTGPMHVGHCRGAVVGDTLANLLGFAGFEVVEGILHQRCGVADRRARPLHPAALREALGEEIGEIPSGLYPGDYLKPVGQAWLRSLAPAC